MKEVKTTRFVLLEKRSKKAQRLFHQSQRGSWNGVNPTSRVFADKRRKKDKHKGGGDFFDE